METLPGNSDYLQGIVDFLHETSHRAAQQKTLLEQARGLLSDESQALYEELLESTANDNVSAVVDFCGRLVGQGIKLFLTLDTSSAEVSGFAFDMESCQYSVSIITARPDQAQLWVLEDVSKLHIQPANAWVEN